MPTNNICTQFYIVYNIAGDYIFELSYDDIMVYYFDGQHFESGFYSTIEVPDDEGFLILDSYLDCSGYCI